MVQRSSPLLYTELNAGNSSRASHVWRVETPQGPEIYRRSWWTDPGVSAFMLALSRLFGVDPRNLETTAHTYRFWAELDVWAVPSVLGTIQFQETQALRLSFIDGDSGSFEDIDAHALGASVARVHGCRASHFGGLVGQQAQPITDFYPQALRVVQDVATRYAPENWAAHWGRVEAMFRAAPPPTDAVPMLLDWNETQFVWRGGHPFALVDVEASVFAPPELDLTFWEVLLNDTRAFRAGYESVRPFPDLGPHRAVCRLILLALESEGSPPLLEWLEAPATFED